MIDREIHQQRLTAAREAVVEAVKLYEETPLSALFAVNRRERQLRAAVAALRAIEQETING